MRLSLVSLALLSLALMGCELRLAVDIDVDRTGAGTFDVAVALDGDLTRILEDAGVEVLAGLDELRRAATGWEIEDARTDDGGIELRMSADFDDPSEFQRLADSLHGALDEEDPRIFEALRMEQRRNGSVAVSGHVGLLLPASPGVRGEAVEFDEDEVERLLEEHGDDAIAYDVRVTLPHELEETDADEVVAQSAVWRAPVGEMRAISVVSAPAGWPRAFLVAAAVVVFVARRLRGFAA
jgi:hypothetical protein